jgi:isoprenylcysteine carboxyl methyltransferase (ICMT) family protein YpbQ
LQASKFGHEIRNVAYVVNYGKNHKGENKMLWTIFLILLVLWALGMVTSNTLGGFIHILLVVALAVILIRVIQGRRPAV